MDHSLWTHSVYLVDFVFIPSHYAESVFVQFYHTSDVVTYEVTLRAEHEFYFLVGYFLEYFGWYFGVLFY